MGWEATATPSDNKLTVKFVWAWGEEEVHFVAPLDQAADACARALVAGRIGVRAAEEVERTIRTLRPYGSGQEGRADLQQLRAEIIHAGGSWGR